jgi:DNA-binding response OmpR family regulator
VARVTALLRAQDRIIQASGNSSRCIEQNGVSVDLDKRRAYVRGRSVEFTKQEFELLHLLVTHPGVVFSRDALVASLWATDSYVTDRTVDSVVSRMRKKLEVDPQAPELILTAWGVGYKFADTR